MKYLKKKTTSILLAIIMLVSMLPMTAFAASYDEVITITVDENGLIATDSNGEYPDGVELVGNTYLFAHGYSFIVNGNLRQTSDIECISNCGEILSGDFSIKVINKGIIAGGTYSGKSVDNAAHIWGGTFNAPVINLVGEVAGGGIISDGTFNSLVTNRGCTITGGTFNGQILNMGGMVAEGIDATVAEAGDLAITKQTYGTGSYTVKQNGVEIPSGKAGECYNVAGFDSSQLIGLYLLSEGESIPTENFEIESEFTAILGGLGGYDFTMPDRAVSICAVFSDYVPPTTINLFAMSVEGTSSEQLASGTLLYDYEMPTVSGFESGKTLTVNTVGEYITVDGLEHKFVGFYHYSYDESTEAETHSVSDTYEIGAEPADKESDEWSDWYTPISDGVYAVYISTGHSHNWAEAWSNNDTHHWHECETENCIVTSDDNKSGYGSHDFGDGYVCNDCNYAEPLEIIPDKTSLTGNGTINFTVNRIVSDIVCSDEFYDSYISGGRQTWSFQMKRNIDVDLTFTVHHYGKTASCTVSFVQDPNALILTPSTTSLIGNGAVKLTGNKDVVKIDCSNVSYDEDISGSGRDWEFVMDRGVEVNLRFEATSVDGETDVCWISFIPQESLAYEDETVKIVVEPVDGVALPNDAELVVEAHTATIEPIVEFVGIRTGIEYIELDEENIDCLADVNFTYNDVTYHINEFVEIDGEKHIITSVTYVSSVDLYYVGLMSLTDGIEYRYDLKTSKVRGSFRGTYKEKSSMVNINGVTYDVVAVINPYELSDEELEADRATYWVLYYNGEPAGRYFPNKDYASFRENCDPATLKAHPDTIFLGTVTIPQKDADSKTREDLVADLEAARMANADFARANGYWSIALMVAEMEAERALNEYDAKAQIEAGKAFRVSAVGSNDIHLENAENVSGRVTQTFAIPDAYVGNDDVIYVAVHTTAKGHEIGAVNLSEDGETLTATYAVDNFSPFTVYAFVETEEPEIKEIIIPASRPSSGSGTTRYTVKFEANGGTETANKTVTRNSLLAEPDAPTKDGYTFMGWFTDEELTEKYDFDSKVTKSFTLYAKWEKHDDEEPVTTEWKNPFEDVNENDWFFENVKYANINELMNGVSETKFAPNDKLTRAMLVTVLWRMENEPAVDYLMTFEDVHTDTWYTEAVRWANSVGVVKGYSAESFGPDDNITREQIAAIMHRYAQYKGYDVSVGENTNILSYDDFAQISEYAISSMQWACGSGLIKGKSASTLNPLDNATRAEIAAILHRFIETD